MRKHIATLCRLRNVCEKSNRRLVVFVDDLDRCDKECIIHTLDAIRLVMDIPNVIVVIAIDHRIAFNAVAEHYQAVADDSRDKYAIARDFLGKIIHLSVMLEKPTDMKDFIAKRLFSTVKPQDILALRQANEDKVSVESAMKPAKSSKLVSGGNVVDKPETTGEASPAQLVAESGESTGTSTQPPPHPPQQPPPPPLAPRESNVVEEILSELRPPPPPPAPRKSDAVFAILSETADDCVRFENHVRAFGFTNPRQLIRLRNTYRLLIQLNHLGRHPEEYIMAMLFWLEFLNQEEPTDRHDFEAALNGSGKELPPTIVARMRQIGIGDALASSNSIGFGMDRYRTDKHYFQRFVLPYGGHDQPLASQVASETE